MILRTPKIRKPVDSGQLDFGAVGKHQAIPRG
jgi:hypothetical protein